MMIKLQASSRSPIMTAAVAQADMGVTTDTSINGNVRTQEKEVVAPPVSAESKDSLDAGQERAKKDGDRTKSPPVQQMDVHDHATGLDNRADAGGGTTANSTAAAGGSAQPALIAKEPPENR